MRLGVIDLLTLSAKSTPEIADELQIRLFGGLNTSDLGYLWSYEFSLFIECCLMNS